MSSRGYGHTTSTTTKVECSLLQKRHLPSKTSPSIWTTLWRLQLGRQGIWVSHWMTSCPSLQTSLRPAAPADSGCTTSGGYVCSPHPEGHPGVGPGSCHLAHRTSCWYACMSHSSPAAHPECSIPGWSTTFPSSPTLREAVHYAAGLPNGLLLPQYFLLSWLDNGGTTSPLTSGQRTPFPSSTAG